jgi:hypothetical protein
MDSSSRLGVAPSSLYVLIASSLIALLSAVASLAGLLNPDTIYPTEALRQFALSNDVANLLIGLPILLGSIWLDRNGKYIGRLLWPGALMYTLYNYLAYAIAMPVSWVYLGYLLIVVTSLYTLIAVFARIDFNRAKQRLVGRVPERLAAGVLILLGAFVFLRVFAEVLGTVNRADSFALTEIALLLVDSLLAPAWILGGILLWRRKPLGYAAGLPLLFQGSMLFIGLLLVLALQPAFTNSSLPLVDIVVVAAMGLICFVPSWMFLRGAAATGR